MTKGLIIYSATEKVERQIHIACSKSFPLVFQISQLTTKRMYNKKEEFVFLTPMDVAKIIGCSIPTARKLFYRDDFPAIKVGKNLKVLKSEFIKWCSERRM